MARGFLKILCLAALSLLLLDGVADAAACGGTDATCHACSCSLRIASPAAIQVRTDPAPAVYAAYETPAYSLLLPKSLFRPPCLGA